MAKKIPNINKKRSSLFLAKMSIQVTNGLKKASEETGLDQWLIAEKILEDGLEIRKDFDAKKWLKGEKK